MKAYLIVNEYINTHKFNEIHDYLLEAAQNHGIEMEIKTNSNILIDLNKDKSTFPKGEVDFILFWDKDVKLAEFLEYQGYKVFNSSSAIRLSDDKSLSHLKLMAAGIPMPRTIIGPMTYDNIGYNNLDFIDEIIDRLGFPMVIKEAFGSFGQQVYLVENKEEIKNLLSTTGAKPILFQEYIKTSHGRDIRLQVVGQKVVASMYRYSDGGDFRANLSIGGKMKSYLAREEEINLALESVKVLGLDFAGVDLLFGEDDKPLVCEVNSNAHFVNIFKCTGVNVANDIIKYCYERVKK